MIIAATGHRPDKLFIEDCYSEKNARLLIEFAEVILTEIKPTLVISGMALGWDQAVAEACVSLQIPFMAAVPFAGQECMWPEASRIRYNSLLACASEVRHVCEGEFAPWKMNVRNTYMVDRADEVLALYDGSKGGTSHTVKYAKSMNKAVLNVWPEWMEFR